MFGVFITDAAGHMTWIASFAERQDAVDCVNGTMLKEEECVMAIPLVHFRQQLG